MVKHPGCFGQNRIITFYCYLYFFLDLLTHLQNKWHTLVLVIEQFPTTSGSTLHGSCRKTKMHFALNRSQIQNNDRFESLPNKLALFPTLCFVLVAAYSGYQHKCPCRGSWAAPCGHVPAASPAGHSAPDTQIQPSAKKSPSPGCCVKPFTQQQSL